MQFLVVLTSLLLSLYPIPTHSQLILNTKAQITRHHHHHRAHHAPSPPEWIAALQRSQQPLSIPKTGSMTIKAEPDAPERSVLASKIPADPFSTTKVKDSIVLNPDPRIKNSDILVSISFTSIPRWPKTGEQVDFLTVPLGKWTRPEDNSGLPQHPLKMKILGARHRSKPELKEAIFEGAKRVVCRLYTSTADGSHGIPITFQLADGEIDLATCGSEWSMGENVAENFGCVLV